jgi:UDP:flavonoid glycosyltransferase YjiC (YdhE family)
MPDVVVFGSPVAVGHVRPLMPLAERLVERGFAVVWAISGDGNEPASAWKEPLSKIGVHFIDVDAVATFERGEAFPSTSFAAVYQCIVARANDVGAAAAEAIRSAVSGRTIVAGVNDYFALWAYVAMKRLGVDRIKTVVSAFPAHLGSMPSNAGADDPIVQSELGKLRAAGVSCLDRPLRAGLIPDDPSVEVLSFSSARLCLDAPDYIRLLGAHVDALPSVDDLGSAPSEHRDLVRRLRSAREGGARVVLLSMGTVVTRLAMRLGAQHMAGLKVLYSTLAAAALRGGAVVVASTTAASAEELGMDEATLGPAARDRLIAMSFVPQPLLFAHGLVDVMLTHGGANTFHEAVMAGLPLLVWPVFGDQESVACTVAKLGVGASIESMMFPKLEGALSLARTAEEILPEMLAPGVSRWKNRELLQKDSRLPRMLELHELPSRSPPRTSSSRRRSRRCSPSSAAAKRPLHRTSRHRPFRNYASFSSGMTSFRPRGHHPEADRTPLPTHVSETDRHHHLEVQPATADYAPPSLTARQEPADRHHGRS